MASANWRWVLVGMAFDVLSYGVQALRWKLLLSPFGKVRLSSAIRSVFAGLFTNLVFPFGRASFCAATCFRNSEDITLGRVLGSVGVERLVDLVIATAALALFSVRGLAAALPARGRHPGHRHAGSRIVVMLILYLEMKLGPDPGPRQGRRRSYRALHVRSARLACHGHRAQLLYRGSELLPDALLPGHGSVGHDALLWPAAFLLRGRCRAADHQSRCLPAQCPGEFRLLSVFLRPGA